MPVAITPLGLGRVRRTDASPQVTVNGTGFSAVPGQNQVYVSGSLAPIVSEGATQITFDLPAPFSLDLYALRSIHVPVLVLNTTTGERSTDAWIWIKGDLDEVGSEQIDTAIPGPFEITGGPEVPERFEARDMQRLATMIEALIRDVSQGNVLAWDGTKLAEPAGLKGSGAGQILIVDAAEPTGLRWAFALDAFLEFGGFTTFVGTTAKLTAGSSAVGGAAGSTENWALDDGTIDLVTLRGRSSAGATLDRVRVLVNGAAGYDSGPGLGLTSYSQAVSVSVVKGDKIELEVTQAGGVGSSISFVGGLRLLVD